MWIVIEAHGGAEIAIICTNEDGSNLTFNTESAASDFAENECLDGIIVEIQ